MAMGVVVMPMIQARASGVLFTRQPDAAGQEAAFINAVWGLGRYAVGGVINPDHYLVAYQPPGQVLAQTIPPKQVMLVCRPQGGEEEVPVPPEMVSAPCLDQGQIAQLVDWAATLEAHFAKPQDVEWALDETGALWLLQSRPCSSRPPRPRRPRPGP